MAPPALKLRIYRSENIYIPTHPFCPIPPVSEVEAVRLLARDYDERGVHTNGVFHIYSDNPLADFRQNYASHGVKTTVLVSIGGRCPEYPFKINNQGRERWAANAVESLTNIVQNFKLDGIDVYYKYINASTEDFVFAIEELITELKNNKKVITVASIAPSAGVNQQFYIPLFMHYGRYIDTVAYQLQDEAELVPNPQALASRFTKATAQYDKDKLLAGYSAIYKDWGTVKPLVYIFGLVCILGLFQDGYSAVGISIWCVPPNCLQAQGARGDASTREITST